MTRISIRKIIGFIMGSMVFGFIGISLPRIINFVNRLSLDAFYGKVTSYMISMMLFWYFFKGYNLTTNKPFLSKKLNEWLDTLNHKLNKLKEKKK